MAKLDFIFVAGAPGSGKSTLCDGLRRCLKSPMIDVGVFAELHVRPDWSDHDRRSREMVFENASFVLKNYVRHGYRRIIANDFGDTAIRQLPVEFRRYRYAIITTVVQDEAVLRGRIGSRRSGFTHTACALAWNRLAMSRSLLPGEFRLDTSRMKPDQALRAAMSHLRSREREGPNVSAGKNRKLAPLSMFVDLREWFRGAKPIVPERFR